jgi:heme A synthase
VVTVVVQVFLAGLGLFADRRYWQDHISFGHTALALVAVLVLLSAAAGRLPRSAVGWAALPFLGYIVQTLLAGFRLSGPKELAALHPVGALVIFWIGIVVARRARVFVDQKPGIPMGVG